MQPFHLRRRCKKHRLLSSPLGPPYPAYGLFSLSHSYVRKPTRDSADELRKLMKIMKMVNMKMMKIKMSAVKMLVASFLPLISIRLDTTHLLFSHSVSSFVCAPTSRPKSDLMDSKLQWTEIFPHLNLELPQPLNVTPYLAPPDALPFVWQARGHLVAAGWEGGWVEGGEGR